MSESATRSPRSGTEPPARVVRHRGADRLYHWCMAACVLTLLGTAFLPIVGLKFAWLEAHWISGVILAALVMFHIVRATIWQDFWAMMVMPADLRDACTQLRHAFGRSPAPPPLPGKYPLLQKLYHLAVAVIVLGLIVTGLMMTVKIDTPFWTRNPYWLSESAWGVIYVIHDLAAMTTLTLVMIHVYFAIRPEKLWITRSMILGWITRREYLDHHDPARWTAEPADRGAGGKGRL